MTAPARVAGVRSFARGFSLVEVLVSMVVVSMGILALAGLLQAATRQARASALRSTAALLADDIADRVRGNPAGAALGPRGYDLVDPAFPSAPVAAQATCTRESPCGPAELAGADLADWTARVRALLPKGSVQVRFHAGTLPTPAGVDVWVGWADRLAGVPGGSADLAGPECPARWKAADPSVRCVALQVAL